MSFKFYVLFSFYLAFTLANVNEQHLIRFQEDTLQKLRLKANDLLTAVSYVDFEIFNQYQCAIECIKEKSTCTGYAYDTATKMCSLFDDLTRTVDPDVVKVRQELKPAPCDQIKCKPGAICVESEQDGRKIGNCVCLNGQATPEDCDKIEIGVWTDFNDWSACSVTCGDGYRFRKRECVSATDRTRKLSNDHCIGKDLEIKTCDVTTCPVYGPWSSWTPCSTFCGIGTKQRNRSCIPPGSNCGNYTHEQRACGEANCQRVAGIKQTEPSKYPMKGYLSIREGDIICVPQNSTAMAKHMADLICKSIGLTRGAQYAVLTPLRHNTTCYPGILCDGTEKTFYECKYERKKFSRDVSNLFAVITRCIVDGGFSAWSEWSPCTKTCDGGQTTRSRTCTEPAPSIPEPSTITDDLSVAGLNCTGDYQETKPCNTKPCR